MKTLLLLLLLLPACPLRKKNDDFDLGALLKGSKTKDTDDLKGLSMGDLEKEMSGSELDELKKSEKELEMLQAKEKEEMGGDSLEDAKTRKKNYMNSASFQEHLKKREKKDTEKDDDKLEIDDGQLKKFMSSLNNIAAGKSAPLEDFSDSAKDSTPSMANNQFISQNLETVDKSLISVLKHPNVFSQLPLEIKNLVQKFERQYDLNLTQFSVPNSPNAVPPVSYFQANNASYSPNSLPFVDQNARIGRRGFLTVLNATSEVSQTAWVVANSRVFCLYNQDNFSSILKLIRNSNLAYSNMLGTPCFSVYEQQKNQDGLVIGSSPHYTLCAEDISEKELWVQQLDTILASR